MKKTIVVVGILVCLFAILIIGRSADKKKGVTDLNGVPKSQFSINETAVYEDIHYTVKEVKYTDGSEFKLPPVEKEGYTYIAVTFEVENNSKKKTVRNTDCILRTNETNSEQETGTSIWLTESDLDNNYLEPRQISTKIYFMEVKKSDVAKEYQCYGSWDDNELQMIFDLTK